jgi:ATP-dependent Clp protease ATP-binding subunit ClpC
VTEAIDACVKLSDRYMTDRCLPDKAIDVLDEVGARVHLKNINVPQNILDLEKKIEDIKHEKNKVVKARSLKKQLLYVIPKNDWVKTSKKQKPVGRRKQA